MKRWWLLFFALFIAGCSSKTGKNCVQTLCQAGEKTCFGRYKATCKEDGRGWKLEFCGTQQYCDKGECKEVACGPGVGVCQGTSILSTCDDEGTSEQTTECKGDELCRYGFCLKEPCKEGQAMCNGFGDSQMVVRCIQGQWKTEFCGSKKGCNPDTKECVDRVCTPFEARCTTDLKESWICDRTGTKWVLNKRCKENEVCTDGFCMPKLCRIEKAETESEEDVKEVTDIQGDFEISKPEVPEVEDVNQLPVNEATINGKKVRFDAMNDARYDPAKKELQIILEGYKDPENPLMLPHIEIYLTGIDEGDTGEFHCEEQGDVSVKIWYKWGKYAQDSGCKDFDYQAIRCTVRIMKFGLAGERIVGSFDAPVMKDCKDDTTVQITHGRFEVYRSQ